MNLRLLQIKPLHNYPNPVKYLFSIFSRTALAASAVGLMLILTSSVVAQSGGLKGKIRNQKGNGIPNATIEARQDGAIVRSARSNNKGDFVINGLRSGKYNISFDADGYSTGVLFNIEVGNSVRDLGGRLILAPDQGSIVFIRGAVFFKEGNSLQGARVDLELIREDGSTKKVDSGYTDISGEFAFRRPPGAGKYRVTARFKKASGSKEITVDNAAIYRTAITLDISRNDR